MSHDTDEFNCPCDKVPKAQWPEIHAGLSSLPRQIGTFIEFRRVLMADTQYHSALEDWNIRREQDLGAMLLEMWAYVCDVLAFYDKTIADESYIRTAKLRPSIRKLVDRLGYIPLPATASSGNLVISVSGNEPVLVPIGSTFRSKAFGEETPQVFEADIEFNAHGFNNNWPLAPQRPEGIAEGDVAADSHSFLLFKSNSVGLQAGDRVVVEDTSATGVTDLHIVDSLEDYQSKDGANYVKVRFDPPLVIAAGTATEKIKIYKSVHYASLWQQGSSVTAVDTTNDKLILDGLYKILKQGQFVFVSIDEDYRWFKIDGITEEPVQVKAASSYTVNTPDPDDSSKTITSTVNVPEITAPATIIELDEDINSNDRRTTSANWSNDDKADIKVHYNFVLSESPILEKETRLNTNSVFKVKQGNRIKKAKGIEPPVDFILQDDNATAFNTTGNVDFDTGVADLNTVELDGELVPPVTMHGNVLSVSRGETVVHEVLGSGNAAVPSQTFKLKKKPLTYIPDSTSDDPRGVVSTLKVWVDGVLWEEAKNFYGKTENDHVYIVRQTDDEETLITGGDGIRGASFPTGADNIIVSYRYGAGAAAPPANHVTQLAAPIENVTAANNPLAMQGGADREEAENIRDYAPKSALVLGRIVSLKDFEAVTSGMPGVRNVAVESKWDNDKNRPAVQIWYIGAIDASSVKSTLRNMSESSINISVTHATSIPMTLSFNVDVDSTYIESDVLQQVNDTLLDPVNGILVPENIGIGTALYRSRIFEAVMQVAGTLTVTDIQYSIVVDGVSYSYTFSNMQIKRTMDEYFDIEAGQLLINGVEWAHG